VINAEVIVSALNQVTHLRWQSVFKIIPDDIFAMACPVINYPGSDAINGKMYNIVAIA